MENSFEEGSVTIPYIAQRTNRERKVTQAAFSRFTLHSVGTSFITTDHPVTSSVQMTQHTAMAHSQTMRIFESSASPSAHLNPTVFWPPAQLSPSGGGDRLAARQCLSTAAAPKDTMQTELGHRLALQWKGAQCTPPSL